MAWFLTWGFLGLSCVLKLWNGIMKIQSDISVCCNHDIHMVGNNHALKVYNLANASSVSGVRRHCGFLIRYP